jgi:hypothetical protein
VPGLIPLLGHASLPHSGTVKDQPKQLSSINRGNTPLKWGGRGSNPRPTDSLRVVLSDVG